MFFQTLQPLTMFVSRQRLHISNRITLVHDLSALQRLDGVLQRDNTRGLAELILDHGHKKAQRVAGLLWSLYKLLLEFS